MEMEMTNTMWETWLQETAKHRIIRGREKKWQGGEKKGGICILEIK